MLALALLGFYGPLTLRMLYVGACKHKELEEDAALRAEYSHYFVDLKTKHLG